MSELSLFHIFVSRLNAIEIQYMVTGSVASIIYGEPRLTHDMDIVIELEKVNIENFEEAFPPALFYCPPGEIIMQELARPLRGHFNLVHHETGFKADIYLMGREDELHLWAFSRRRRMEVEGEAFWVAPPEYVILRKLQYFKEGGSDKHVSDILGMLEISFGDIDTRKIKEKAGELELLSEWESVFGKRDHAR